MLDNKNLYPTPDSLARKMLGKVKNLRDIKHILEPSIGYGDIVDFYKKYYKEKYLNYSSAESIDNSIFFDCIEIDRRLQDMLRGRGFNLVYDDFLTYEPIKFYDLIIMNPPFDNGCKHLLKAIEVQERIGGQIVCILNAETLKNDYSNSRKILKFKLEEEYNADIEYIENAFIDSERKTGVEIALVYINIPMKNKTTMFEKDLKRTNPHININHTKDNFVSQGFSKVEQLVFEYEMIKKSTILLYEEQLKIQNMMLDFGMSDKISIAYDSNYSPKVMDVNEFINEIRLKYWKKFIEETDFKSKLPSKLRDEFSYNLDHQKNIEFNLENVEYFSVELMNGIPKAYEETVAILFDDLTRKYHYSESAWSNTIHMFNGWKSNDAFKINKKVIIPMSQWDYGLPKLLQDLNLVFENMSSTKDNIIEDEYLKEGIKNYEKKIETEFFLISTFKKGTMHIEFKDQLLLDKFNIIACKGKNWLPMDFGKKAYNDMDSEEKRMCKEFGLTEDAYNQVNISGNEYLRLM